MLPGRLSQRRAHDVRSYARNSSSSAFASKRADLQACLDHFAVPKAEQGEIFALVDSTKSDIVLPASTARP